MQSASVESGVCQPIPNIEIHQPVPCQSAARCSNLSPVPSPKSVISKVCSPSWEVSIARDRYHRMGRSTVDQDFLVREAEVAPRTRGQSGLHVSASNSGRPLFKISGSAGVFLQRKFPCSPAVCLRALEPLAARPPCSSTQVRSKECAALAAVRSPSKGGPEDVLPEIGGKIHGLRKGKLKVLAVLRSANRSSTPLPPPTSDSDPEWFSGILALRSELVHPSFAKKHPRHRHGRSQRVLASHSAPQHRSAASARLSAPLLVHPKLLAQTCGLCLRASCPKLMPS